MIIEKDPITQGEGYCMPVSRAATAIYCVLKKISRLNGYVLVPANLCYAGVFPIIYAGMNPLFCDVDHDSGNVTVHTVREAIRSEKPVAMIIPHMYGNPVSDLQEIADLCRKEKIILIEDCASAMGAEGDNYHAGSLGDYVVYSTGYSKILDLGYGGFLVSRKNDLKAENEIEKSLDLLAQEAEHELQFWSPLYRLIRNRGQGTVLSQVIYEKLAFCLKNGFLYRISEDQKSKLLSSLCQLPEVIKERRDGLTLYQNLLGINQAGILYHFSSKAVPWRFNLLIDQSDKKNTIIQKCLSEHLPVSDWYPVVTPIFNDQGEFPGAEVHGSRILNFPLLNSLEEKQRICHVLNEFLENK